MNNTRKKKKYEEYEIILDIDDDLKQDIILKKQQDSIKNEQDFSKKEKDVYVWKVIDNKNKSHSNKKKNAKLGEATSSLNDLQARCKKSDCKDTSCECCEENDCNCCEYCKNNGCEYCECCKKDDSIKNYCDTNEHEEAECNFKKSPLIELDINLNCNSHNSSKGSQKELSSKNYIDAVKEALVDRCMEIRTKIFDDRDLINLWVESSNKFKSFMQGYKLVSNLNKSDRKFFFNATSMVSKWYKLCYQTLSLKEKKEAELYILIRDFARIKNEQKDTDTKELFFSLRDKLENDLCSCSNEFIDDSFEKDIYDVEDSSNIEDSLKESAKEILDEINSALDENDKKIIYDENQDDEIKDNLFSEVEVDIFDFSNDDENSNTSTNNDNLKDEFDFSFEPISNSNQNDMINDNAKKEELSKSFHEDVQDKEINDLDDANNEQGFCDLSDSIEDNDAFSNINDIDFDNLSDSQEIFDEFMEEALYGDDDQETSSPSLFDDNESDFVFDNQQSTDTESTSSPNVVCEFVEIDLHNGKNSDQESTITFDDSNIYVDVNLSNDNDACFEHHDDEKLSTNEQTEQHSFDWEESSDISKKDENVDSSRNDDQTNDEPIYFEHHNTEEEPVEEQANESSFGWEESSNDEQNNDDTCFEHEDENESLDEEEIKETSYGWEESSEEDKKDESTNLSNDDECNSDDVCFEHENEKESLVEEEIKEPFSEWIEFSEDDKKDESINLSSDEEIKENIEDGHQEYIQDEVIEEPSCDEETNEVSSDENKDEFIDLSFDEPIHENEESIVLENENNDIEQSTSEDKIDEPSIEWLESVDEDNKDELVSLSVDESNENDKIEEPTIEQETTTEPYFATVDIVSEESKENSDQSINLSTDESNENDKIEEPIQETTAEPYFATVEIPSEESKENSDQSINLSTDESNENDKIEEPTIEQETTTEPYFATVDIPSEESKEKSIEDKENTYFEHEFKNEPGDVTSEDNIQDQKDDELSSTELGNSESIKEENITDENITATSSTNIEKQEEVLEEEDENQIPEGNVVEIINHDEEDDDNMIIVNGEIKPSSSIITSGKEKILNALNINDAFKEKISTLENTINDLLGVRVYSQRELIKILSTKVNADENEYNALLKSAKKKISFINEVIDRAKRKYAEYDCSFLMNNICKIEEAVELFKSNNKR